MKMKRILCAFLSLVLLMTVMPAALPASAAGANLVPTEVPEFTANYVCTWNIQDWVAWHENNKNNSTKRDVVDPDHIFGNSSKGITGWADLLYPDARGDMLFLLDDGWDLPYGTTSKSSPYFGSMILPDDKFPTSEYGSTPQEKLKTLNEKMKAKGWAGTGLWICAQESSAYSEYYYDGNVEAYWKARMEWCKYAGISYWKVDWGNRMKDITWQNNLEKWADEVYPELILEHAYGGTGGKSTQSNKRLPESYIENAIEYGGFSDVYRTYDVLDNLMTCITLDRVGEQLLAGYTDKGTALGLMNAEDEMYIAASLGLTMGVMRFDPDLAEDTQNSGSAYFDKGTEPNTYYAGGKKFVDTRATRTALDEVTRAMMWQRIAPAYTVGDYDVELANNYLTDSWTYSSSEKSWEGDTGTVTQRAPAAIARGIDLPTVTTSNGSDIPYLTASRNPNGAISIATHARTTPSTGYTVNKNADVKLNAGDLTGLIGVFGYYGSLTLTFNQDLTGKTVLAQDLLATESQDITSRVTISGNTITIDGDLLADIGLSEATSGDTSLPGLVIQIGSQSDFVDPAEANARKDSWELTNASFEQFNYDASSGYNQTMKSVTGAGWRRSGTTSGSYITADAHSGSYAGTHAGTADSVTTYQLNKAIPNGTYRVSAWVKSSGFETTAKLYAGSKSVNIGTASSWTQVTVDNVQVSNNQLEVGFTTDGTASQWLIFDDVAVEQLEAVDESAVSSDIILEFDFSDYDTSAGTVNGVVYDGGKAQVITANTVGNVSFTTDSDGNDIAVFPAGADNTSVGITWQPGELDPIEELTSGSGATINIWLKPATGTFNSPLFMYGQCLDGTNLSHCVQTIIRGGSNKDLVLYRGDNGSSGGQKITGVTLPVNTSDWQMYTLVENGDKSISLYYNGQLMGTNTTAARGLLDLATDEYEDYLYIGCSPLVDANDTNFTGSMDTVTVYNGALGAAQIQALYDARSAEQTEIVLLADGNGVPGGQAVQNDGYIGWIGYGDDATGDEGTVSYRFYVQEAGEWTMDVYYLSKSERGFEITLNGDTANEIALTCPAGESWDDPSLASSITAGVFNLNKGTNTIVVGNSNGNSPSLVKVVLIKGNQYDVRAAEAVETMILQDLAIVDNYEQLPEVQACRAAYDALTDAQKALVDPEVYKMLTDAEILMEQWGKSDDETAADAVTELINAIGTVTSVDQAEEIEAARAAFDALTEEQKALVDAQTLATLEAAEDKLAQLYIDNATPGDVNYDGEVNVIDIITVKRLISTNSWTPAQLAAGDVSGDGTLTVLDMVQIKSMIMSS